MCRQCNRFVVHVVVAVGFLLSGLMQYNYKCVKYIVKLKRPSFSLFPLVVQKHEHQFLINCLIMYIAWSFLLLFDIISQLLQIVTLRT